MAADLTPTDRELAHRRAIPDWVVDQLDTRTGTAGAVEELKQRVGTAWGRPAATPTGRSRSGASA